MDLHSSGAGGHCRHHPTGTYPLRRPAAHRRHVHGDYEPSAAAEAGLGVGGGRGVVRGRPGPPGDSGGGGQWRSVD